MGRSGVLAGVVGVVLALSSCPSADPCHPDPCAGLPQSACTVHGTAAICGCPEGTSPQGGSCLALTPCSPDPCSAAHQTVCTADGGAFTCSCDPGYAPEGQGCAGTPVWDCSTSHADGGEDPAEPDECPTLAAPLAAGPAAARTLFPAGDHDWLRLETVPGHVYRLRAQADLEALALLAEVFTPDGFTVLASDSRGTSLADVLFQAPSAGLLARVRALRPGDTGAYTVTLADLGLDDYPSTAAGAPRLVLDARFEGAIQFPGDVDTVRVLIPGLTAVRIAPVGGGSAVVVDLLRADGGLARTLQDQGAIAVVPADEELVLRARGRTSQDTGPFALQLTTLGPDDHGDDLAFATPIDPDGGTTLARIDRPDDLDVLAFTPVAGHAYLVGCLRSGYGCQVTVVTASGAAVAGWSSPAWLATGSEPVLVVPQPAYYDPSSTLAYLRVDDLGADDHTEAPGTPIALGVAVAGTIQAPDDVDSFSFTAPPGHAVVVAVNVSSGVPWLVVEVRDAQGALVSRGDGATSFLAGTGSPYRATVRLGYGWGSVYTLTATDTGPDDHADTPSAATPLTPGTPATGSFQYQGDLDAFSFTAAAGHVYSVACASPSASCQVTVRDALGFGVVLATLPGGYLATRDGPLTLELSAGGYGSPVLGTYEVTVTDTGLEDHGDTPAAATPLALGTLAVGRIGYGGDHDVFSFPTTARHVYRVVCTAGLTTCEQGVAVLAADGEQVVPPAWGSGQLLFRAAGIGTLFLDLSGANIYPGQFAYTMTVTDEGPDDHGDTAAAATPLALGTPAAGSVQFPGDVDVFSVGLTGGHFYRVDCGASTACLLTVRGPDGAVVGAGSSYDVVWLKAGVTGAFSLHIASYWAPVPYTLTATDLGVDDHGDTAATATPVTVGGGPVSGVTETPADLDVFSFDAGVDRILRASCTAGDPGRCGLVARDRLGLEVARSYGGTGAQVSFLGTATAPYTVAVSGAVPGPYQLTVEDLGVDDHGNDPAHATPLDAGIAGTGVLQYQADVDAFRVALGAGDHVAVVQSAQWLQVTVLDGNGLTLGVSYFGSELPFASTGASCTVLVRANVADWMGPFTVLVR